MSKIVFITDASSGIGQALARQCAAQGAVIGLVVRRIDVLYEFIQTLSTDIQSRCYCYAADIRSVRSMHYVTNTFVATVGLPNVVIANAGISVDTDLREPGGLKTLAVVMDTNWMGVLNTLQPFVGPMLAHAKPGQPGGTFVGIVDVAGVHGLPGVTAYSASKSVVIKLMGGLRMEFDPLRLRVMTIAPGYVHTPMTEHNPYPMPLLMPVNRFVLKTVNAIHRGACFTVLPWPMGMIARLPHVLPRGLYDFAFTCAGHKPRNSEISS